MLRVLDLFSGIGGFSLGLERAGKYQTAAFCEMEPFAERVLAKNWPHVPCYADVRRLTMSRLQADGLLPIDVICGGFPCQDISGVRAAADAVAGIKGEKSGLWKEIARLVGEVRPRFVVIENVPALCRRGLDTVLKDLAPIRYDAEWFVVPASAVGAPHRRDRIWIVAYPAGDLPEGAICASIGTLLSDDQRSVGAALRRHWETEPRVPRVGHGLPDQLDRNRCLGNAVVPQVVELIGRSIIAAVEAISLTPNHVV